MPSRPHTQRQAAIQDREREALTATGVRGARPIALRVRVATLRAFRSGNSTDAAIREGLAALVPQLKYGMTTAHLQGRLRSIRSYQAATRDGLRLSDPFRSAVDFLTKRMKLTPDQLVDVADGYGANIDSVIQTLGGDLSEKVNAAIADTVRSGDHVAGGMEKIRAAFDASGMGPRADWQIENIYRTQVQTAYAAGKWQANQDPAIQEILWGYEYVTVGDDRVRPTHAAMDGTKAPKDDPIWQTWTPPCGWNCVARGTPVLTMRGPIPIESVRHGDYVLTHKLRWRRVIELHRNPGPLELVSVNTKAGAVLRLTGQHQVFTHRGWVEASRLEVGDVVIHERRIVADVGGSNVEEMIESQRGNDRVVPLAGEAPFFADNFNADLLNEEVEVEPVPVGGLVECESNLAAGEDCGERGFPSAHADPRVYVRAWVCAMVRDARSRRLAHHVWAKETAAGAEFGGNPSGAFRMGGVLERGRFAQCSPHDSMMGERTEDGAEVNAGPLVYIFDAGLARSVVGESARESSRPRFVDSLLGAQAVCVGTIGLGSHTEAIIAETDMIASVEFVPFDGSTVYNLGVDEDESYFAGGIATHNCRCSIIEVFHGDEQAARDVPPSSVTIDGVAVQPGPDEGWEFNPGEVYRDVLGAVGVGG